MKKGIFNLIIIFFMLMLLSCGSKQAEKVIKIGFLGPLTGDYANYGKLMSQAVKIAVEEKNAEGGIDNIKIELIAEDSEGDQAKGKAAMEKLASRDKIIGLVGPVFSSVALVVAPICQSQEITMISPSSTHQDLTNIGDYIFRDIISDSIQGEAFARYVSEVLKLKKIAVLYIKNDYSQGLSENFMKTFKELGGEITAVEIGQQNDKDFKTQLTKIKATNPQAIYIPNYVAEIVQILDQAKQLGIKAKMLSADGFSNPEVLTLAGKNANGVIYSGPELDKNSLQVEFEAKYNSKWGENPDSFSLNAYDAANLLIDAIEYAYNKGSDKQKKNLLLNRSLIKEYVSGVKGHQGVSGDISFMPNGDVIKNIAILTVENLKYKQLGVYKIEEGKLVQVK